jgi:outer membrane protein OmpA-like peptidoglycan-associated protein
MVALPTILVLATSGCASKKYVSQQVNPVNQKLNAFEKKTNDQISYLTNKEQNDISQVNERIATTDQRLAQVASVAQEAQGTASRAMGAADVNKTAIAANTSSITTLESGVANALNYQLVENGDVTFEFNKSTLTPSAKAMLDQIVVKVQAQPRAVVELAGFTDRVGSSSYNFALSRRRAEAVQRYLVQQKVPPREIHIVGLGKEAPPEGLELDLQMVDPHPSKAERNRLARRVHIRVFGAGDITNSNADRSEH